jgi:hypothetical protein
MVCFVAAFSYPVLARLRHVGVVWDWPEFVIRYWVAFHSVHHFHQLPLWNPYSCGGMPLLAHPSSQIMTPLFALALIFGPFTGMDLQIPVHLAIAWSGGYVLGRVLGMGPMGRLNCASIFPASSWFYLHIGVGHLNFLPTAYLPWVAAMVLIGVRRQSLMPWAMAGLVIAIMFGEGGVYQPTQAATLATLIALWFAIARRSWWPIAGIALMAAFGLGFGAVKLLPSWQLMRLHPRPIEDIEYSPVRVLLQGLFAHHQFYDRARVDPWGFWELGAYLSPAAAVLAVLGLAGSPRRTIAWLLAAVLFFILAIGGPYRWFPWPLLHKLPIFSWERMPERFLIVLILLIGLMAGFGADFLAGWFKPLGPVLAAFLLLIAIVDAWTVDRPNMDAPVVGEIEPVTPAPQFIQVFEDPWSQVAIARSNRGALHCNEELDFCLVDRMKVIASNQPGYRGEYYLLGPGTLAQRRWTPNALSYDVVTPGANVMVINQNYDSNWRLAGGAGEVFSHGGLLAVRVPAGAEHLRLLYRSIMFWLGAVISLLTCALTAVAWIRERRRPGA